MNDYAPALPRTVPVAWEKLILKKTASQSLTFDHPPELEAGEPPEARGLERDQVRLMVSHLSDHSLVHSSFRCLPDFLEPRCPVMPSGTLNAS
jgi:S-adenosylmethionine:tRNA ribosyltransferase-isomerase